MIDILVVYAVLGVIIAAFEWLILVVCRIRIFEFGGRFEKIAETIAHLIVIFIWPLNVYWMLQVFIKMYRGKASEEELNSFFKGYDSVRNSIEMKYEKGDTENDNQDERHSEGITGCGD